MQREKTMTKLFIGNGNFRNFLLYRAFNTIGSGIFAIFIMWVVHAQYQNPIHTGIAGFMFAVPRVASFLVGPIIDKCSKNILLRCTCFSKLCVIWLLLAISYTYYPGVWFLHLMILIFNVAGMIDLPAGTALLPKVVNSEELIRANALIGILSTLGGLGIGVMLYFIMSEEVGFELVYAINAAVLFISLIFSIFTRGNEADKSVIKPDKTYLKSYFIELKMGLSFVKQSALLHLIIAFAFLSLFAEIHTGSASGYVLLVSLALVGGVIGPYISSVFGHRFKLSKIFIFGFIAAGVVKIVFVNTISDNFTRALWIYVLYAGLASAVGIFYQTLIQKLPPKHVIGRIKTIQTSLFAVAASVGALAGGLAGTILPSADSVLIIQGASYIVIGVCLCLSKHVRKLPKISDVMPIAEHPAAD